MEVNGPEISPGNLKKMPKAGIWNAGGLDFWNAGGLES